MLRLARDIQEFYEYVLSFYSNHEGNDSPYPIATPERINQAVTEYLKSKPLSEVYFDSFDRENVRKIIEPEYSIFIP